MIIITINVQT